MVPTRDAAIVKNAEQIFEENAQDAATFAIENSETSPVEVEHYLRNMKGLRGFALQYVHERTRAVITERLGREF